MILRTSLQLVLKVKSSPGEIYLVMFGEEGGFGFSFLVLIELGKRKLVLVSMEHQLFTKEPS